MSLQWHINTVRPTGSEIKPMDGLTRRHPGLKSRGANNTRRPPQSVCQDKQRLNVLHVELYTKQENAPLPHLFVSSVTSQAIFPDYAGPPSVHPVPIGIQGDHGAAEAEATIEAREAVDPSVLYVKLRHLTLQNL